MFEKEFLKAMQEYENYLENKKVKGNLYEPIPFQSFSNILYNVNPVLNEEDLAKAYALSIGMI